MTSLAWAASFEAADISAMQTYEDVLVPRLFTPWARLLLDRLDLQPGDAILDVACGPGSLTRPAAIEVGPAGRVTGVDLSPAMLALALAKPALPRSASIEYHRAPADRLPVADGDFDVAACQQGLQFFTDPAAALRDMRRALRPDGRVAIAVWAEIGHSPPFAALEGAVREVAGDELADLYRNGPWGMPDADRLGELLERAGFNQIRVMREELPLSFDSAAQLGSTLAVSPIRADLDTLPAPRREQLGHALERRVAVNNALQAEAVANLAFARWQPRWADTDGTAPIARAWPSPAAGRRRPGAGGRRPRTAASTPRPGGGAAPSSLTNRHAAPDPCRSAARSSRAGVNRTGLRNGTREPLFGAARWF